MIPVYFKTETEAINYACRLMEFDKDLRLEMALEDDECVTSALGTVWVVREMV